MTPRRAGGARKSARPRAVADTVGLVSTTTTATVTRVAETEAGFQGAIVDLARTCGWRVWHDQDSRRNEAGWPDLVLVRDACLIFAEVKTETGKVTKDQREWLDALDFVAGMIPDSTFGDEMERRYVRVFVWRPADWPDISKLLTARSSWRG